MSGVCAIDCFASNRLLGSLATSRLYFLSFPLSGSNLFWSPALIALCCVLPVPFVSSVADDYCLLDSPILSHSPTKPQPLALHC